MRAVQPAWEGTAERAGATLRFEVYGEPGVTIVLLPTWEVVDSRIWKMQIGYLSRHFRVVVYDAAGTGRSSRPAAPTRYTHSNRVADALAVLDATVTTSAVVVGSSMGGEVALCLAAYHPDRVLGVVAVAPRHPWSTEPDRGLMPAPYDPVSNPVPDGWAKFNPEYWRHGYADFAKFFMTEVNSDPHSSKGVEDAIGWALEQTPEVLSCTLGELNDFDPDDLKGRWQALTVPTLLVHGTEDRMTTVASTIRLRDWIREADLLTMKGAGHSIVGRYPIRFNHAVHEFATAVSPKEPGSGRPTAVRVASWATFGASRKRVLYLSSPVGLGHARRDVAIAGELQALHPDVEIDWLAQHPVTRVLDAAGLRIHPASAWLASESAHIEAECGEHALDAFQSMRTMDEIMCHNFHIFDEVLESGQYDLVIADEAFDVDHYLFENAQLKKAPLAWMTDFVGFLPMAAAGPRQAVLTADYNLEMLEHVARHPRLRDAAVFVGSPEDIVDGTFGDGLPAIRDWAVDHFDFSGYVTGFDPRALGDRRHLRASLGFAEDEVVCVVSVGGSGVGTDLLRRVVAAYPAARDAIPPLRMIVVTGPRIDPHCLPHIAGVEYHGYVDRLFRWLTAADLAIVQGGLTTTMELTAARVPFIYVPLRDHFEQNHHVRARLARYHAGLCLEYDELDPDTLAEAMLRQLTDDVRYNQVETDGAARAARLIDQLL